MIGFLISSILLGVGLAMDAFSVSIANGLNEPDMTRSRECLIAGVYAFFQCLMPLIGWFCVHALVQQFRTFEAFIPWIALILLLWIGGKMLREGIRESRAARDLQKVAETAEVDRSMLPEDAGGIKPVQRPVRSARSVLTAGMLLAQGIATSIDALSAGFAIANYSAREALGAALIIAAVTFIICMAGLAAGQKLGERVNGKAGILGGCILIFIGLEIFVRGVFL